MGHTAVSSVYVKTAINAVTVNVSHKGPSYGLR